jgi:hypothetical protein
MSMPRPSKSSESLKDRLVALAKETRERATLMSGQERYNLLQKARQADTAAHIDKWVNSPGLQPPK